MPAGKKTRRALILYEKTGAGHLRVAEVIADALTRQGGWDICMVAGSDYFKAKSVDLIAKLWNTLVERDLIKIADALVNFFFRLVAVPVVEIFDSPGAIRLLAADSPDLVICTADGYGKTLGTYCKQAKIPFAMCITDLTVFRDLVHPEALHIGYFCDVEALVQSFDFSEPYYAIDITEETSWPSRLAYTVAMWRETVRNRHVVTYASKGAQGRRNAARFSAVGAIAGAGHYAAIASGEARRSLGIPDGRACVLVLSGSLGGKFVEDATKELAALERDDLLVVAMCGKSEHSHRHLKRHFASSPSVRVLSYVADMPVWLAAADLVVARPSAGIVVEALLSRSPLVFPGYAAINDISALELVRDMGLGEIYDSSDGLSGSVLSILANPERYRHAIDKFMAPYPKTYDALCDRLLAAIFNKDERYP